MRMLRPVLLLPLLAVVETLGACSTFEPNVGPLQNEDASAAAIACALGASGYGTAYGSPSGQAATNDFCTADGGTIQGPCDVCEAASCCAQRIACYSDHTCSCADTALDSCTGSVTDASAPTATAVCWSTFSASGSIAATRYACLRTSCQSACQIPN